MTTGAAMSPWRVLFGFDGAISRGPFIAAILGASLAFLLGVHATELLLPWMAEVLAPRGINAGFALNGIWSALGLMVVWALMALLAKRLRAVGRSPWWAPAAVLPLAILALTNDAIFLVSRSFALPGWLNWLLLVAGIAIALGVLATCLWRDS